MIEELQHVDESVLTSLVDLRRERDALRQRLTRMQEAAGDVSEKVLARVRADYEARIAALEEKAVPLKDAARGTYGRLLPALERAREACETRRLDREEIDLRHTLGEWSDEEHGEKIRQADAAFAAAEAEVAAITEVVGRVRDAFDSPAELAPATTSQVDIPAGARPKDPEAATSTAGSTADSNSGPTESDDDGTLLLPPEPPAAPAPPPPPALSPEPPVWTPAWSPAGASSAPVEEPWKAAVEALGGAPPPEVAAPAFDAPEAPTSGIPAKLAAVAPESRARLEALDADLDPQPHFLEPLTFIGRTPENQIRIYKPAVSRRHAQITETDGGWLLRDLSSENGTYVNGQRVTERLLVEGDRVQFGTSRFVLRLGA